jgi:hypothetical protein
MGTTKLALYQRAAGHCKTTAPSTLTENLKVRRLLDLHYQPAMDMLMEGGFWNCAMRSVKITENATISEAFGYTYAHDIPTDLVRIYTVSSSDTFDPPLDEQMGGYGYLLEGQKIWADVTPIYLRYTSDGSDYGTDLTRWTERMAEAMALELAYRVAPELTGSDQLTGLLMRLKEEALGKANTFDALQQTSKTAREGRWTQSRFSNGRSRSYQRA